MFKNSQKIKKNQVVLNLEILVATCLKKRNIRFKIIEIYKSNKEVVLIPIYLITKEWMVIATIAAKRFPFYHH